MCREQPVVPKAFGSSPPLPLPCNYWITGGGELLEEVKQQRVAGGVRISASRAGRPPFWQGSPLPLALGSLITVSITFPFTTISLVLRHCL